MKPGIISKLSIALEFLLMSSVMGHAADPIFKTYFGDANYPVLIKK